MSFVEEKPRIQYNGHNIDFDLPIAKFKASPLHSRVRVDSPGGTTSALNFTSKEKIEALLDFQEAHKIINELRAFYEHYRNNNQFKFWRDRHLGGYWAFENSLKSNDLTAVNFTRSGAAWYRDPTTGLYTQSADGEARFPGGKFGRGLLIEGARTNEVPAKLSNWTNLNGATLTADTSETEDPFGANGADKIEVTSLLPAQLFRFDTSVQIDTDDAILWCFAKTPEGTRELRLQIRDDTGALLADSTHDVKPFDPDNDFGNVFQRFEVKFTNGGSNANNWRAELFPNAINEEIYISNPQLEVGAGVRFPSTPVDPTSTAPATRNEEIAAIPVADVIDQYQGAISFWYAPSFDSDEANQTQNEIFVVEDSGSGLVLLLRALGNGNFLARIFNYDGSHQEDSGQMSGVPFTRGVPIHFFITFDSLLQNDSVRMRVYANGVLVFEFGSVGADVPKEPAVLGTNFYLGGRTGAQSAGIYDDLWIYKRWQPAGVAKAIFNQGRALAIERNLYGALEMLLPDIPPEIIDRTDYFRYALQAVEQSVNL